MASRKTRQLTPEELRGFANELQRTTQYRNYANDVRTKQGRPLIGRSLQEAPQQRGNVGGNSDVAAQQAAWERAGNKPNLDGGENPWDPIRVGSRILDGLGALGYGANGAAQAMIEELDPKLLREDPAGQIAKSVGAFATGKPFAAFGKSVGDALSGNTDDLTHGFEIVENATDKIGGANPAYKDVQDNVDPIVKGVAGFGIDVLGDPLTYAPAGPGLAAVKGAFKAGVGAAKAAPGGDIAKTFAFLNPVTGAKGAASGVKEWTQEAAATTKGFLDGLKRNPVVEEAAQNLPARTAANIGSATGKAATPVAATATAASKLGREAQDAPINPGAAPAVAPQAAEAAAPAPAVAKSEWDEYWQRADANAAARSADEAAAAAPSPTPAAAAPAVVGAKRPIEDAVAEAAEDIAEKTVRTRMAEQLAPDIARAADVSGNTDEVLANLRALTYTTNRYPQRVQREIQKLTPFIPAQADAKLGAAAVHAARMKWTEQATELVGADNAKKLRKITDPEQFQKAAREMARERTQHALDGLTPTEGFRKLTSNRNEFDPAKAREVAKLLGLKDIPGAGDWKSMQDYLRRSNPYAAYNESRRMEVIQRDLLATTSLPGRGVAEQLAKDIDPDGARVAAASEADELIDPAIREEYDAAIAGIIPDDFGKLYPFTNKSKKTGETYHTSEKEFGDGVKAVNKYTFNQHHQLTLWKNLFEQGKARFGTGLQRQGAVYDYLKDGLKYTDLRLRGLGIVPVNGATSAERALLKSKGDYAFLSFGDVMDALDEDTAKALLFSGKDLNVPITLLSDTARQALRNAETQQDSVQQVENLFHYLQSRLYKETGSEAKKDMQAWLRKPQNKDILKAIAGAFARPETIQSLAEANIRNMAFAVAVNGKKASKALEPIVKVLRAFAADPNVSTGKQIDAVLGARDAANQMIKAEGLEGSPADGLADAMLDKAIAETTSSGVGKQVRAALAQDRAVVDASGKELPKAAKDAKKAKVDEAVEAANVPGKEPKKPASAPQTEASKKAAKETTAKSNTARKNEHVQVQADAATMVREILEKGDAVVDSPVMDVDAAYAAFTQDLPAWLRLGFKGAEKMDGWFGKENVKQFAISSEMNSHTMQFRYTKAVNEVAKAHDVAAIRGAIAIFRAMDGNAGLEHALTEVAPSVQAAARDLWPTFSVVFDHSDHGALQRIGMDGAYLNDYLKRQGVPDQYLLNGEQTWENGTSWTRWNWDNVENPLAILDNYHRAIVKAQVVPDVAANFSAQFGNKSTVRGAAISNEEARSLGWVRADTEGGRFGGLFQFLDKEQYYPKEMLTQLSLMDRYFGASRTLDENTLFDNFFRYADPVVNSLKASITLWRPGHHITNIMGEFLMNTLAGVYNPLRYAQASRILANMGKIDGEPATALQRYMQAAAPEGVKLKDLPEGTKITLGGKETRISDTQLYQILDRAGVVIHHNQAEDLLNEGLDVVGRTGVKQIKTNAVQNGLHRVNKLVAPGWLGTASANRDNLFRLAHAIDILDKRSFANLSDAVQYLTKEINSYHPNMLTLGAFEQKYVRRLLYFYTWQRQAITRIALSTIDTPGRIMIAPKALYNISAANGAEPESWGQPVPDQAGIPTYLQGNIGQFMFKDGLVAGDPTMADDYLWGASINAPQLDILQSTVGSIAIDPNKPAWEQATDAGGQWFTRNIAQNLTPLFRVPFELQTGATVIGTPIKDKGQYLLDQTGLRAPLIFTGARPGDENDPEDIQRQKKENALFNWATGVRRTIYDGPEQRDIWERQEQTRLRELEDRTQ